MPLSPYAKKYKKFAEDLIKQKKADIAEELGCKHPLEVYYNLRVFGLSQTNACKLMADEGYPMPIPARTSMKEIKELDAVAVAERELRWLQKIQQTSNGWQRYAFLLERVMPERYGRRNPEDNNEPAELQVTVTFEGEQIENGTSC